MADGKVHVGLVGTGFGYRTLLPALCATPTMSVDVICSAHIERAQMVADAYQVPKATNRYEQLLEMEDLDLICICTPPFLHAEMTMAALESGKNVFSTKPLATGIEEARAIMASASRQGITHSMDLSHRYMPVRRHFRNLVKQGFLGDIRYVSATIFENLATSPTEHLRFWNWVADKKQGGGILRTSLMNHHIDLMRYTFGEIRDMQCVARTLITEKPVLPPGHTEDQGVDADTPSVGMAPVDTEDAIAMLGTIGPQAQLAYAGTWSVYHPSGARVEAYGSEGTLILEPSGRLLGGTRSDKELKEIPVPSELQPPKVKGSNRTPVFTLLAGELAGSILGTCEDPVYATFEDGLRLCEIAHEVLGPLPPS